MREIATHVYLEDRYPGPVLGLAVLARGLLLIDTPPCPDSAQAWQHAIRAMNGGFPDRVLVLLDQHPDRSLGAAILSSTVVAHEDVPVWFQQHGNYLRATERRGDVWEACPTLGQPRWPHIHVTYNQKLTLYLGDIPAYVHHHPGPSAGTSWVEIPHVRVLFVGDTVVLREPPFLAEADLPRWLETLRLLEEQYGHYLIVSGRDGLIEAARDIPLMRQRLQEWHEQLHEWGRARTPWSKIARQVEKWLALWQPASPRQAELFRYRLLHGVGTYYRRWYLQTRRRTRKRSS